MEKPLFRSARLKIKRADHHIKELIRILRRFEKSGLYRASVEGDTETASKTLTFEMKDEMLDTIALVIGDVAHNLRTALDHVAYELVVRSGGTPNTSTKFPFGKTRKETISTIDGVIQGICLDIITCIVECVQPYRGGNGDALYTLHRLDITDKHRLIVPVFSTVGVKFTVKSDDGSVGYMAFVVARGEEARVIRPPSGAQIERYSNLMLYVLFDDVEGFQRRPVVKTLHEVRQLVLAVVEEVERAYLDSRKVSCLGRVWGSHDTPPT